MKKTTFEVLSDLEKNGFLEEAISKELIPTTVIFHKQVYSLFLMYSQHENKSGAVMSTAVESNISERSVYYIIKKMES